MKLTKEQTQEIKDQQSQKNITRRGVLLPGALNFVALFANNLN